MSHVNVLAFKVFHDQATQEREAKKENLVVYGLKESNDPDGKKRKEADVEKRVKMEHEMLHHSSSALLPDSHQDL